MTFELSKDQREALDALLAWHADPAKKRHITLGGYAGTGKTTLISVLRARLAETDKKSGVAFCSYTGRAAQNLKNKLCEAEALRPRDTVSTIHGLIYTPIENSRGEIVGWERKDSLAKSLIIVDEASMVDEDIWRDLASFGAPVLAVGDHGQLPPISGRFDLMRSPDIVLSEIHRQARGNPIIAVSEHARHSGHVPAKRFGPCVVKYSKHDEEAQERSGELLEAYRTDTMILCGYNSTRNRINRFIRNALGYESPEPMSGDRVICLRNNRKKAVYNGMLGTVSRMDKRSSDWYSAEIDMDDSTKPYSGLVYAPQFGAPSGVNFTKDRVLASRGDLFDFGYALTVHKAQGGQARRVVMFEERFQKMDDEMWRRWLYTAVTRAEEELYIFG